MRSALFPNFLPQKPHAFWIFLGVSVSIFLASLGLKIPYIAQNIAAYWHQENPIALTDFSACPELNLKNLQHDFSQKFPSWHLTSLKGSSFQAPLPLNAKIDFFFSLSPKNEGNDTLSLRPSIEKFLSQNCPKIALATLPDIEEQEIDLKSLSLERSAGKLSHFFEISALALFVFSFLFLGKARFQPSQPQLIFLRGSALSTLKICRQTLYSLNYSFCLGLFSGILFSNIFYAYFLAHFFQKSFFRLFFHGIKEEISAAAHLSATPDLILILTALSLYVALLFSFVRNLRKKLHRHRQTRIFLSDNNPFG
ncbi:hypothetical protein FAI41_02330 [Acetobacteraceae bacterium]|nr:hypothetical protein FAI41_02330 [Acetobacteraceae bacterium]